MNASEFHNALVSAIDERKAFEAHKSATNDSMQKTLNKIRASLFIKENANERIAEIMLASNCDANAINKSERVNARRNVYSYEKDINIARALASSSEQLNHYTSAIFRACVALREKNLILTHADAASACSLDVKSNDKTRESIIKAHKYQKHVEPATASTQSSSSVNALKAFNVLRETRDAANQTAYEIDVDAYATKAIAAKLNVAI